MPWPEARIRRYHKSAPPPASSDRMPPTAIVPGIPIAVARAPAAIPPIGTDAEKTVV